MNGSAKKSSSLANGAPADGSETTKSSEPSLTSCMVCASLPRMPPLKMSIWMRPLLSSITFFAKKARPLCQGWSSLK